ncbi:amine oxidase [Erythrobacter sp. QSSC1-22B]|uniref:NAD(P)/FAD-dependent oxidoreductase n=1 Tax=Erythrobacter sp. QSSC1-22B TaxID=1860125 RepID=UPI00080549A8|nr:NAD(P)/FAD-dependent oxidoreductase [Erythrobacter sp. QSSC1-22B]OBX17625.1 amine oxidase [Erythrobacter sp. QSSC1-22B]
MTTFLKEITIIGGGFAGLSAGYDLARAGHKVTVLEADDFVGGLAGAFEGDGERIDRFYHHWFTNDLEVMGLIENLGMLDEVVTNPTNTGVYYNKSVFKLSTPMDLLRFSPLPFMDRIRLGVLTLRARGVKDWRRLEEKTASEWLRQLGGARVYEMMWEPLLQGKFGPYAEKVSAVWFWNKLKLRGGSRGSAGEERLAYFKGSFARLAEATAEAIREQGGEVHLNMPAKSIAPLPDNRWAVEANGNRFESDVVIATPALPLIADMIEDWAEADYLNSLRRIDYLANVCLVLELDRSLSSTYWLNVNDPSFPFVGVIEHTNFESPETYGGKHIVYLSKYLPHTDELYAMSPDEVMQFSLPHLKMMFPDFQDDWIHRFHVWKARWSQPVVEKHYSQLIPSETGPREGLYICSMAQIYPEDRGTNYAIREGRKIARKLA